MLTELSFVPTAATAFDDRARADSARTAGGASTRLDRKMENIFANVQEAWQQGHQGHVSGDRRTNLRIRTILNDQLTPTTGPVAFRIRANGFKSPFKTQQGKWLAPILVEEQISSAAASPYGTAPKFDNLRSHLRRMGRNATKREIAAGSAAGTPGGKRRAADVEDGEISDGGASRASVASSSVSKLARKAQNGFDIR